MLVGTWPECEIIRYEGGEKWHVLGRVGFEREVMAASVYNGKCYFGTLPMANIFRMDEGCFTFFGNVDNHPNHYLRRAWSMAVHQGALYTGTLPLGRVMRRRTGAVATHDHALPAGWHHLTAVRGREEVAIYLDGKPVARNAIPATLNLDAPGPLRIGGAGIGHAFTGALRDVRYYSRALDAEEIARMART